MPRRVSRKRSRRSYPRRPGYGRKKMRVSRAQKGYLQTAGLYGRFSGPKAEMKFLDHIVGPTPIVALGTQLNQSHNVVGQGNGASERIGRKIIVRSLQVKGHVSTFTTPTLSEMDQRIRIMFVCDKQTNGSAAAIADVMGIGGVPTINGFRDLANLSRFVVLYDKTMNLPVLAATATQSIGVERGFSFSKKLNLPIEYDETFDTGALSTQRTNNIFSFALSASNLLAPDVHYHYRIRYTDAWKHTHIVIQYKRGGSTRYSSNFAANCYFEQTMVRYGRKRKRSYGGYRGRKRMTRRQRGYVRRSGVYGRFRGRNAEMKFHQDIQSGQTLLPVGTMLFASMNVIPEGNGPTNRIGRKITIRSVQVRGRITTNPTIFLANMEQRVRLLLVCDKQTNGAAATLSRVLNAGGAPSVDSFREIPNLSRFRILWDRTYDMNTIATTHDDLADETSSVPVTKGFSISKKLNLPIEYDDSATTGVISTIRTNNLFMFGICDDANEAPSVRFTFRVRYSDAWW